MNKKYRKRGTARLNFVCIHNAMLIDQKEVTCEVGHLGKRMFPVLGTNGLNSGICCQSCGPLRVVVSNLKYTDFDSLAFLMLYGMLLN